MANWSKPQAIYNVAQPAPTRVNADGVVEKVTKLPSLRAVNRAGHVVDVPLANANQHTIELEYGIKKRRWLEKLGTVFFDKCPVATGQITQENAIGHMGEDYGEPCMQKAQLEEVHPIPEFDDKDTGRKFVVGPCCKHIAKLLELRRKGHEVTTEKNARKFMTSDDILKQRLIDQVANTDEPRPKRKTGTVRRKPDPELG